MTIRRRTGVIVGIDRDHTAKSVTEMSELLAKHFPDVKFAFIPGGQSVAFEWDEEVYAIGVPDPSPPPRPNRGTPIRRRKRMTIRQTTHAEENT